jgi:GT2 family glycosyltransferase
VIRSLAAQTFKDFELLALDNGSADGSAEALEKQLASFTRPWRLVRSAKNLGFAGGHNRLFAMHEREYVLCVNQDVKIEASYLEKLISWLDAHPRAGSASGKLFRGEEGRLIDSAGLRLHFHCAVSDIGSNEPDAARFNGVSEVFGVSGALPLYRRAAVLDASSDGSMFDAAYFAYKEDVDLAWRMRLRGWEAYAIGDALAWHTRTFGVGRERDPWRQKLSVRNHLFTLVKCLPAGEWTKVPAIVGYELAKAAYLLVRSPRTLAAYAEVFERLPYLRKNRKLIQSRLRDEPC